MYEREYTCTRKLTTVTTISMIAASGSMPTPNRKNGSVGGLAMFEGCSCSQLISKWSVRPARVCGKMANSTSSIAMPTAPIASQADSVLLRCVKNTFSTNASSGRPTMISATVTISASALHQVKLVDLDGAPLPIDRDHDRQPHRGFGGCLGDDEDAEQLPGELLLRLDVARESHEQQIDAIQHQLDGQQNADRIAA